MYTYEQATGKLYEDSGNVIGIGYSGAGDDKNNPASEGKVAEGPIPCGRYRIMGPPKDSDTHGPYVLRLEPDAATRAHILSLGRDPDSFLMHGDSVRHPGGASEGCVIQDRGTRERVWDDNAVDPDLEVVSGTVNSDVDGEIAV